MLVIGHRGAPGEAPENTIASFEAAVDAGAEAIEFDVALSADGVPVIAHDENLERVSGQEVRVSQLDLAELRMLDVSRTLRTWPTPERIPTLAEVLERFAGRVRLFVELKAILDPVIGFRSSLDVAQVALPLLAETPGIVVSSFDPAGCAFVRERTRGAVPVAHTIAPGLDLPGFADRAAEAGATQLHVRADLFDDTLCARVREAGLELYGFTVNSRTELRRMIGFQADGFFTDEPRAMLSELRGENP